jgi:hypothetical protein
MTKFWRDNLIRSAIICLLGVTGFSVCSLISGCSGDQPVGRLYEDGTYSPINQLTLGVKYSDVYESSVVGNFYRVEFDRHIYIVLNGKTYYYGGIAHDPDCPCHKKNPLEKKE